MAGRSPRAPRLRPPRSGFCRLHCPRESSKRYSCPRRRTENTALAPCAIRSRTRRNAGSDSLDTASARIPCWQRAEYRTADTRRGRRSEEHTSELQSPDHLVCRLLLEKKKKLFNRAEQHKLRINRAISH